MSEESRATNGLSKITKTFGSIITGLILAGVIGIVVMATEQSAIATTVKDIKERMVRWDARLIGLDNRLRQVEIGQANGRYGR